MICWQKSRELVREIYKNFRNCADFGFKNQIQRAAISITSNIAEGFETFKYLNKLSVECSKLISSFIKSLKTSEFQGLQFKKEKTKRETESEKFMDYLKTLMKK